MRYFRMLTNALLAGALAAVYIVIVFLQGQPAPAARSASAVASACCRRWLLFGASGGVFLRAHRRATGRRRRAPFAGMAESSTAVVVERRRGFRSDPADVAESARSANGAHGGIQSSTRDRGCRDGAVRARAARDRGGALLVRSTRQRSRRVALSPGRGSVGDAPCGVAWRGHTEDAGRLSAQHGKLGRPQ